MKIKKNNDSVSEVLGTILLLLIAVTIFVIIQAHILSNPTPHQQPYVTIVGEIQGKNITLLHSGGEPLSLQTKVTFEIGENVINIVIWENDYLDSKLKIDGEWNIGESLIFSQESELNNLYVKVTVVDVVSNTIVMDEILQH
jgi:FlaG/FlaF family flagellin (archaellin)